MNADLLKAELTRDEGLRLKPYRDSVGKLTLGIGRNLDDVGISEDEAQYMLGSDIARTVLDLDRSLPWWESLDEVRQRVILNMAFNMGVFGLLTFKNTLTMIHDGRYGDAADGMLASLWAKQVGPRALRLAQMMRDGKDPTP
jgi:lysozyme